ncbi:MAG TPA: response regulator transcription factor [Bacteroidetes bacterium]|nr:response regulator transcription factor [Bacteroidota bacterium]
MSNISVIIADSQCLVRVGLRHLLQQRPDCRVVAEATNEGQLMEAVRHQHPDLVVMDYNQPGRFTPATVALIKENFPNVKLLVISGDDNKKNIYQVLENGVNSFLSKQCDEKEILDAVDATSRNEKYYCTNVLNHLLEKSFPKDSCAPLPLTPREIQIVRLIASGLIAKEIADRLNLSTHTVYTHRKNIMKKLHFGTTSELVLYAVREGII